MLSKKLFKVSYWLTVALAAVVFGAALDAQAAQITFSGSYDGSYEPDSATPPAGQSTWIKFINSTCTITPNSDGGTPAAGVADFNDNSNAGRLAINRAMGAGTFSSDQANDEYIFEARLKLSSTAVFDDPASNGCPFAVGFRDEYNGTTNGKSVWLGWYVNTNFGPAPLGQPGLWLLNPEMTGRYVYGSPTFVGRVNTVNYYDDQWHTYRLEKFLDEGVAKIRVFVDGIQEGPTFNYSNLANSTFTNQGFGYWTSTPESCRNTVDYIRYGAVPEPSTLALLAAGLLGLLCYAWKRRK